jgi:hypothetical protein
MAKGTARSGLRLRRGASRTTSLPFVEPLARVARCGHGLLQWVTNLETAPAADGSNGVELECQTYPGPERPGTSRLALVLERT